jgi:hypothetical protein
VQTEEKRLHSWDVLGEEDVGGDLENSC